MNQINSVTDAKSAYGVNEVKITRVEAIPLKIPTKYEFKLGVGVYDSLTPVIVKLHTNLGVTGVSEVQSSDSYDRIGVEPYRGVVQLVEETFGPRLVGMNPFEIEVIWREFDELQGLYWVKAGLDTALYDIMGKMLQTPACRILGGPARTELPVEGVGYGIPMTDPKEVARIAADAVKRGYTQLELKVGDRNPHLDIERLRLTREAIGPEISIKADFNKGGEISSVISTIRKMEEYGLDWVEQPLDYWNVTGLARIRQAIHTPLVIDEPVNTPQAMYAAAAAGAADAIHLKPTIKCGLTGARRIAAIAEAAGIAIIPGTLNPTGIGIGVVHTFAAACRYVARGIHGSPQDLLVDDIVTKPVPPGSNKVTFSMEPGLGYELDPNKVEKYRVK